ncbi:MAG: hypothetical protein HY287_11965 [Planctomycetes bacterium]|nr:hypothetical protein [Planctomycetota bacterium]
MNTLSQRIHKVETLRLAYKVLALLTIVGLFFAVIFFFAAYTSQVQSMSLAVSSLNVEGMWRSFKMDLIVTGACAIAAIVLNVSARSASKSLDRYSETHCSDCGHDLAPVIAEKLEKRKSERKTGTAIHGSSYFDIYCPSCKCQRTMRE